MDREPILEEQERILAYEGLLEQILGQLRMGSWLHDLERSQSSRRVELGRLAVRVDRLANAVAGEVATKEALARFARRRYGSRRLVRDGPELGHLLNDARSTSPAFRPIPPGDW